MSTPAPHDESTWVEPWSVDEGEAHARALLNEAFGVRAHGVWSAPGRVNIVGEHTDYNHGLCLPTLIAHRTFVAGAPRDDDVVRIVSARGEAMTGPGRVWEGTLGEITRDSAAGWPAYVAGVLWALQERGFEGRGMDLAVESCVPAGAGLGSSAALECATAWAVCAMWGIALDSDDGRITLAEACIDAENHIAGAPTGGVDQHTVMRCAEGEAVLLDFRGDVPEATSCPLYFPDYGLALLVIDTQVPHRLADGQFGERRADCERAAAELGFASLRDVHHDPRGLACINELSEERLRKRVRHVYTENDRVMLVKAELSGTGPAHERFIAVGKALFRSHASMEVDLEASTPELNLAVDAAFRAKALGARIVGGGFGGAAIALVRRAQAEETAHHVERAFDEAGFARPQFLIAR